MRLFRVLPASLPEYAVAVPWLFAVAHASCANAVMLAISEAPGHALKSPIMMRCAENPDDHAFNSPICTTRRALESASRWVEKRFTRTPLPRIGGAGSGR